MNIASENTAGRRRAWGKRRAARCLCLILWTWLGVLGLSRLACAESGRQRAIGFSRLAERTEGDTPMHYDQAAYRLFILDELRRSGLDAVGGEDTVFGRGEPRTPELVLGGTVREYVCKSVRSLLNCRIALHWEVLDLRAGKVLYDVHARTAVYGIRGDTSVSSVGRQLISQALSSLLGRPRFISLLNEDLSSRREPEFPPAVFKRCAGRTISMPSQASLATDATVVVEAKDGLGSGFFINDEGLLLSAAHVVARASEVSIHLRDGRTFAADVVRVNFRSDSALLRPRQAQKSGCLELSSGESKIGTDVYAIGAPSGQALAFSLTRGIVSGVRESPNGRLLQTDASINPGNSGGPLLGADGRVLAIVSWKVIGAAIEGLAFGVPIDTSLAALGLTPGPSSSPDLMQAAPWSPAADPRAQLFSDRPDPVPSLDPEDDELRAEAARETKRRMALYQLEQEEVAAERREREELARLTPGYVPVMRWGGLALAGVGLIAAIASEVSYDQQTSTRKDFESLRLWNDLAWVSVAVGAGSLGASLVLTPRLTHTRAGAASPLGPAGPSALRQGHPKGQPRRQAGAPEVDRPRQA